MSSKWSPFSVNRCLFLASERPLQLTISSLDMPEYGWASRSCLSFSILLQRARFSYRKWPSQNGCAAGQTACNWSRKRPVPNTFGGYTKGERHFWSHKKEKAWEACSVWVLPFKLLNILFFLPLPLDLPLNTSHHPFPSFHFPFNCLVTDSIICISLLFALRLLSPRGRRPGRLKEQSYDYDPLTCHCCCSFLGDTFSEKAVS